MINTDKMSKEELNDYMEELTYRHIINYRRPELLRILGGEKAVKVIPQSNQRSKLYRDGILKTVYGQGKEIILTQKARKILEETT